MLYGTTRSKVDTYTAQRALKETRAPDGGLFVPVRLPQYSREEILGLKEQTAAETIAQVLNQFFACRLSSRDVEFLIGRNPYRLVDISHRIAVSELWRNADGSFGRVVRVLTERVSIELGIQKPGEWMQVATRIALLFAIFGELERKGQAGPDQKVDIAVAAGDFTGPMAAWYARKMGLPIGTVVCCCKENGSVWDLLRRGQMRLDPQAVPDSLERLVYGALGWTEVEQYLTALEKGSLYTVNPEQHRLLREGMYVSVASEKRLMTVIPNVYNTNGYILCPNSAVVYAGLMDFRSMSGENGLALMLCEESPLQSEPVVASALGIGSKELRKRLNLA